MSLLLAAIFLLLLSGLISLLCNRSDFWALRLGSWGAITACILGIIPAIQAFLGYPVAALRLPWSIPYGSFYLELDALSAFFLLPIFGLSGLAAWYGIEYLEAYRDKKTLGIPIFYLNLLISGMVLVVTARNAILFLTAWEIMSLSSFFLVTWEDERESVCAAGWTYLVATHLGTTCLLAMFILLGKTGGSLDFDQFRFNVSTGAIPSSLLFLLALVGFGTKAGIMPFHVWLPEAHPAAPSQVSAVMSGVMVKTGIYGILRFLTFSGIPPFWWGVFLIILGLFSGIYGVLLALCQHDLKRLLAYHTVENIGIILMGLGLGFLGLSLQLPVLSVLGFAGSLLHVVNHALFKGLLFLDAGAVLHSTGTLEIDRLGGLLKRLPTIGLTFCIGAAAITGLPPLNGFVSEFLIYLAALQGSITIPTLAAALLFGLIAGLGLIGGLALACFTKAFGIIFLGEPRSPQAERAHPVGWTMRIPVMVLAVGCIGVGIFSPFIFQVMGSTLQTVTGLPSVEVQFQMTETTGTLYLLLFSALGLFAAAAFLGWVRQQRLIKQTVDEQVTWDCGYAQPTVHMQYTASSFAQPLTDLFDLMLHTQKQVNPPEGIFPSSASLHTHTPDIFREKLFRPIFTGIYWALSRLRWLQHGRIQLYVLYIAATLSILLVWKLR